MLSPRREMSLSSTFRSAKIPRTLPPKSREANLALSSCASGGPSAEAAGKKAPLGWCVYLIASSRIPRTYVGVTTDFPRRLRQHNGELKGGAKASSAGRPWNLACLIEGFGNRSEDATRRGQHTSNHWNLHCGRVIYLRDNGDLSSTMC